MWKIWERLIRRASIKALDNLATEENYLLVRQHPRFRELSSEAFLMLYNTLMERHYSKNEIIFEEGSAGICIFLVKQGRVEIYTRESFSDKKEVLTIYNVLERGALFGEISVVSMSYRTSSARALDADTTLLTLSTYDLDNLFKNYPRDGLILLRGITDSIVQHLMKTNASLKEARKQILQLEEKLLMLTNTKSS